MAGVLHDADDIRVACVLVHTVEGSVTEGLVLTTHVGLVNPHFNELLSVLCEVREGYHGLVQEFREHILVELLLVLVVSLNVDYFHAVAISENTAAVSAA